MTSDPTLMCHRLVGLDFVTVLAVRNWPAFFGGLRVHIETCLPRPLCQRCGAKAQVKDRTKVELVDLPSFGRPARLIWHKRRWRCVNEFCWMFSWTEQAPWIVSPRLRLTARTGRWATVQVGRHARDTMLPAATQVVDPFHLVKAANQALDEPRRRVQNDTLGHRGRKGDPLWRSLDAVAWRSPPGHARPPARRHPVEALDELLLCA